MEQRINLESVYRELQQLKRSMVTKAELQAQLETLSILANPATMRQIQESERNLRAGQVRKINSVADL